MKQEERQARSKGEILQAALAEFGTRDYDAVTMDSICSRHGISTGMMYHNYANKDDLFYLYTKQNRMEHMTNYKYHKKTKSV